MTDIRKTQERVLLGLLRKAEQTLLGKQYHFPDIKNYDDFKGNIPVRTYDSLKPVIEKVKSGESDVLWPGEMRNFAVSSGTTGVGKHLPLRKERLQSDRRFMRKLIRRFLIQWPEPQIWFGKQASLPGSIELVMKGDRNLIMGEISGFTARYAPRWLTPFQVVSPQELCLMDWKEKFDICLHQAIKNDVRVISAVPSWTLIFLQEALKTSAKDSIDELWPNLRLIVSGGAALRNYRQSIESLCSPLNLQFMESYGASEGYFAFTRQIDKPDLQLVIDNGIFYEWVPFEPDLLEEVLSKRAIPSWKVKTGVDYIMLVTTNSGLWRYPVNDIIRFTNIKPLSIEVRGRVSEMLDVYGEAVHFSELETALERVQNNNLTEYKGLIATAHPPTATSPPSHVWIIKWDTPNNAQNFESEIATAMDQALISVNRHYAIRRESGALGKPLVIFLPDRDGDLSANPKKKEAQTKPLRIISYDNLPEWIKSRIETR